MAKTTKERPKKTKESQRGFKEERKAEKIDSGLPEARIKEIRRTDKGSKCLIQNVRIAFVYLDKPNTKFSETDDTGPIDGIYCLTGLIPKNNRRFLSDFERILEELMDDTSILKGKDKATALAIATKIGRDGALLKDGDNQKNKDGVVYDGLEGHYTLRAKTDAIRKGNGFEPKVAFNLMLKDKSKVDRSEIADVFYAGAFCDVGITFKPFKTGKNLGIASYLNGAMKLKDGPRLGGSDIFDVRDDIADDVDESLFDDED